VDDSVLAMEAEALAVRLSQAPAASLAATKRLFAAAAGNTLERQLDLEAALQGDAGRSVDFAEGVRAFMEKRPPRYGV
jgi:2-(1,2-epoxy-1,2-dihydrophenyl)acetyl-CoA isomerase